MQKCAWEEGLRLTGTEGFGMHRTHRFIFFKHEEEEYGFCATWPKSPASHPNSK